MLIAFAALLGAAAFVILTRLLWVNFRPGRYTTLITVAAAVLVLSLGALAATGRLHWLAALGAALLPFLRRGVSLLRYLPWLRQLFGTYQGARGAAGAGGGRAEPGAMTVPQALEVLGLSGQPSRDEVIEAHRRLMQRVHPDRGGSTFLAQQLNEAKRVLLKANR